MVGKGSMVPLDSRLLVPKEMVGKGSMVPLDSRLLLLKEMIRQGSHPFLRKGEQWVSIIK